jgi:hypothetical protein
MSLRSRRTVVAVAAGLLTVASLGFLAWQRLTDEPAATGTTATVDGLTTEVREAGWIDFDMGHVMDGQGGFMMPDQMMPDAPSGDQVRLGVTVTLVNTTDGTQEFNLADEFALTGGVESEPRPISADSIGNLPRLGPGAAIDGVLYFDIVVPTPEDPPLLLQWTRDGDTVLLEVPMTNDRPPEHSEHG